MTKSRKLKNEQAKKYLCEQIKILRKKAGLKQQFVADHIGVAYHSYNNIELGTSTPLRYMHRLWALYGKHTVMLILDRYYTLLLEAEEE